MTGLLRLAASILFYLGLVLLTVALGEWMLAVLNPLVVWGVSAMLLGALAMGLLKPDEP